MRKSVKIVAVVIVCVLLDLVLHLATSVYSTAPKNPQYSIVAISLGMEITALLWAIIAFSGAAFVYFQAKGSVLGEGKEQGLRYGFAIALLWICAMLEGVSIFGNPIINEFFTGLSDAIPVFIMGILLSLLKPQKEKEIYVSRYTWGGKAVVIAAFAATFVLGRYIAYCAGLIRSGYQTRPLNTFLWTLLMGVCIGVACVLLGDTGKLPSLKRRAAKFAFLIFGINWATFQLFMPLLFSGYLTDVLFRIVIDTTLVTIGHYLSFILMAVPQPRLQK